MRENEIVFKKTKNFTCKYHLCVNPNYEMKYRLISYFAFSYLSSPVFKAVVTEKYIHQKSQRKVKQILFIE